MTVISCSAYFLHSMENGYVVRARGFNQHVCQSDRSAHGVSARYNTLSAHAPLTKQLACRATTQEFGRKFVCCLV
jgi:hypothetical protein